VDVCIQGMDVRVGWVGRVSGCEGGCECGDGGGGVRVTL